MSASKPNHEAAAITATAWDLFQTINLHHPKGIDANFVQAFGMLTAYIINEGSRVTGLSKQEVLEDMNKIVQHYMKVMETN